MNMQIKLNSKTSHHKSKTNTQLGKCKFDITNAHDSSTEPQKRTVDPESVDAQENSCISLTQI